MNPLIEKILNANDDDLFILNEIKESVIKPPKGTFSWYECDICGEIVFENAIQMLNWKPVCIPCSEKYYY